MVSKKCQECIYLLQKGSRPNCQQNIRLFLIQAKEWRALHLPPKMPCWIKRDIWDFIVMNVLITIKTGVCYISVCYCEQDALVVYLHAKNGEKHGVYGIYENNRGLVYSTY